MMSGRTHSTSPPDLGAYVERFELALASDPSADLARFVPSADHPDRLVILCEIIRVDLELRWDGGRALPLEDYRERFPTLFEYPELVGAMAFEEFRLRLQHGERPTAEEYRRRFGLDARGWLAEAGSAFRMQDPPAGDDMERAACAYRTYRRGGAPGITDLDALLDSSGAAREHSEFLRDLDRVDPAAAERFAEAVGRLPRVGGRFLGFRLCGELGRGAFGRVYLARQGDLADRMVALKVTTDAAGETAALARLQHTNVVPIYSVHRQGALQAVCMPFLGTTTLADTLAALRRQSVRPRSGEALFSTLKPWRAEVHPPVLTVSTRVEPAESKPPGSSGEAASDPGVALPSPSRWDRLRGMPYVTAVLWLTSRLADGLAHAHERGILHRDIKPANILFADDGEPLLLDFNLAADLRAGSRAAAALVGGTLPYMSPEHLAAFREAGTAVDARSDLYSLGVILHELLAGVHPFPDRRGRLDDVLGELIADRLGPVPDVRRANPAVSPAAASIVRHCLEPDPARRYQSVQQLHDDLRRQLDDLPLRHAPEPSIRERAEKWTRRHPRVGSSAALGLAFAVVLAGVVFAFNRRQSRFGPVEAAHALRGLADDHETAAVLLLDPAAGQSSRAEGVSACRRALGRFGVLDSPAWSESTLARNLAPADRDDLRHRSGDLLVLWAGTLAREAARLSGDRRYALVGEARRLNSLAATCYGAGFVPRACHVQQAELAELAGDVPAAELARANASRAPFHSAREVAALVLKGDQGGSVRAALAVLTEAGRREPQDFGLWMYLGQCLALQGRLSEADDCFTVAVALRPRSPWPYFQRGRVAVERGDCATARLDLDRTLELRPDLTPARVNRALARLGLNDPAGAVLDLTSALEQGAPETRIYFIRAEARERAGDRAGADLDRAEGLRRVPTDAESWVARGLARLPTDPSGALADFEGALALDPKSRPALQNKASVLSERFGRAADAVAVLDRAVSLYPDHAPARVGRGVLHARLGARPLAHSDGEAARRLDPSDETTYRVACIYALTARVAPGDRAAALRTLAAAFGRQPSWLGTARTDPDLEELRRHGELEPLLRAFEGDKSPASG